jgi:hypothetical protein
MRFDLFVLPALVAVSSAQPTEISETNELSARDEYRWCEGTMTPNPPLASKTTTTDD